MDTEHVHHSIIRLFAEFCATGGRFVDLGLSAEQLVCLFNECLQVAKYHHDHKLYIVVCILAAEKNQKLGNNDVLLYAKEMLRYAGMFGSVLKERYEVCRYLIIREKGIVSHDPESKTVLVAIAAVLAESIWLKNMERAAYHLLAIAYVSLNQLEDTIHCILRLIEIATEMSDNRGLAHGYHFLLAKVYYTLNQYDHAVIYANKYIDLAKEINLNDGLSGAYRLLVNSCQKLKRYDHVIKYAREYFDVAQTIQVHPEGRQEGNSVFVLADLLDNPEQCDHAVIDGKKCYKISIKVVDVNICQILLDLGQAYLELQTEEKTLFYCEQAIKLVQQCDKLSEDINSRVLQQTLYIAGIACSLKSHYAKAHYYFSQILKKAEESKDSANIALLSNLISALNTVIGVCNSCSPNISELTEILIEKDMVTEESLNNIKFYQFHENFEIARKHELDKEFELALSCYKKLEDLFDGSFFTKLYYYIIRMNIARMNYKLHRFDTALSLYREICKETQMNGQTEEEAECQHMISVIHFVCLDFTNAENCARTSVDCFEKVFDLQRTKEEYQIAIVDKYIRYYEFLTTILIITNQNIEALETVDRYRARALKTQLIMNYQMDHDIQGKPIQYSDIQSLVSKGKYTIVQYFACRHQFIEDLCIFLVPSLCDNEEKLIRLQPNLTLEDMEKLIKRSFSEMKVRLMDCENRSLNTDTETDDGKTTREDDFKEDAFEVEAVRTLPSQEEKPPEGNESSCNSVLEILHGKLIHNVISDVETDEVVFIPDGPLFKVPFAALRDPETGLYLSETNRIRIAPSISTLQILSDRPADFECEIDVLIVGDPSVGKVICNGKEKEIPALKSAFNEAFAIKHVFRGHSMEVLLQEDATKTAVLEKLQQGASIVHIAAHGNAAKATIALAPLPEVRASKIPEEDDYMLTMADVQKVNVRAKLVVLSCCHSGRGEIKAEGVVGMCRAFLASGARAVVASLCAIEDNATRLFMMEFYRNLKEKNSASLSLHLTMKYMREEVKSQRKRTVVRKSKGSGILYSEPRYWAPFFLIGDDVIVF